VRLRRAGDTHDVRIVLTVTSDRPPAGWVVTEGAVRREPFTGWLDLFRVLEQAMKIGRSTDVPAPAPSDTRGRSHTATKESRHEARPCND
jgi:hypothetical protein